MASEERNTRTNLRIPDDDISFGRLLKAAVRSIAVIEDKAISTIHKGLGGDCGLTAKAIEYYEGNHVPPSEHARRNLALAGVERGLLGPKWLKSFLATAKIKDAKELTQDLFRLEPKPLEVRNNLYKRLYSNPFFRRPQSEELREALTGSTSIISVVGPPGSGKTRLVHEEVSRFVQANNSEPAFDSVIWVGQPEGPIPLDKIIDVVAQKLGYTTLANVAKGDRRHEFYKLLQDEHVLLIIDNAEQNSLELAPLVDNLRLASRTKVVLISSKYLANLQPIPSLIVVENMANAEAQRLVRLHLWSTGLHEKYPHSEQLSPLIDRVDGNPKLIVTTLDLLKRETDLTLEQALRRLRYVRDTGARTPGWDFVDPEGIDRDILFALYLFDGAAKYDALRATVGTTQDIHPILEQLKDYDLIAFVKVGAEAQFRYQLTRQANEDLKSEKHKEEFGYSPEMEKRQKSHLIQWVLKLCRGLGVIWKNIDELEERLLHEAQTAWRAANWAYEDEQFDTAITILKSLDFLWYITGQWHPYKQEGDLLRISVAYESGNRGLTFEARGQHIQFLCRQKKISEADAYIKDIPEPDVALNDPSLEPDEAITIVQSHGYYHYYDEKSTGHYEKALRRFTQVHESSLWSKASPRLRIATLRWLGACTYRLAKQNEEDFIKAEAFFHEAEALAEAEGDVESQVDCRFCLGRIALDRAERIKNQLKLPKKDVEAQVKLQLVEAEVLLERAIEAKPEISHEDRYMAQIQLQFARLHIMDKQYGKASSAYNKARRLYDRLDLQSDRGILDTVKEELQSCRANLTFT